MNRSADGFVDSRGAVLVASSSSLFMSIVGDMLTVCGFETAHPAASEAAWLSVTRTQPALVICDSGMPAADDQALDRRSLRPPSPVADGVASRGARRARAQGSCFPDHAAWLTFPVDRDAFRATIDALRAAAHGSDAGIGDENGRGEDRRPRIDPRTGCSSCCRS